MRILWVTPCPPARDGIADYSSVLMSAASAAGHTVGVISIARTTGPGCEVVGTLAARTRQRRLQLDRAVAAWNPDVVHVQFGVGAFGTRVLSLLRFMNRLQGCPIVVTLHEVTRDLEDLRGPGRTLYRKLAAAADRLIVHNDNASRAVQALGVDADLIDVIAHHLAGLPAATATGSQLRQKHGLGDAQVLLAFGFIHVDKGLDDLVRALDLMVHQDQDAEANVCLVVAGAVRRRHGLFRLFEARDHVHCWRVRRFLRRTGTRRYVVWSGYVPAGHIEGWFTTAKAVVLPYRRIEESGVARLASRAGTRLVVSDVGGLANLAGASVFPYRDVEALAAALARELAADIPALRTGQDVTVAQTLQATISVYRQARSEVSMRVQAP